MGEREDVVIELKNVSYKYPATDFYALKDVSLTVRRGEVLLITGPTGAGKTTLCYVLNGLVPHFFGGVFEGEARVLGYDIRETPVGFLSTKVGLVFSDPLSQLVSATVEDEVAFGLENLGLPEEEIMKRVKEVLEYVELYKLKDRPPYTLSGGEQQAVALASILAMDPEVYVLDEPTSNLDPIGTMRVLDLLKKLAREKRKTIIIVEHKLEEMAEIADRMIVMNEGKIIAEGTPREILTHRAEHLHELGLEAAHIPLLVQRLMKERLIDNVGEIPLTLNEGVRFFDQILSSNTLSLTSGNGGSIESEKQGIGEPIIRVENLVHVYPGGTMALKGVSMEVYRGDFLAIIGQNGSGKTTLVKHFNGLLKPTEGKVTVFGMDVEKTPTSELVKRVGYIFQDPDRQLFTRSVKDELIFGPKNIGLPKDEIEERIERVAKKLRIDHLLDRQPYSLGKGEKQRVAIASILVMDPEVIVLDEPTTGQDPRNRREIMDTMKALHEEGKTIVFITHDMNLVAEYANRCIVMSDGRILLQGSPKEVFREVETLETTRLKPPTITSLFLELSKRYPIKDTILTLEEAVRLFRRVGG